MDILLVILTPVLLLLASGVLMVLHVRAWRAFQHEQLGDEELDYRRRQFRRRMQTSAMLGFIAAAMLGGYFLTERLPLGWFVLVYWTAVMGVVCWVALLALVDIWATKHHFDRLRHHYVVEQARLQSEVRRLQAVRGNGKAAGKNPIPRTDCRGDDPE